MTTSRNETSYSILKLEEKLEAILLDVYKKQPVQAGRLSALKQEVDALIEQLKEKKLFHRSYAQDRIIHILDSLNVLAKKITAPTGLSSKAFMALADRALTILEKNEYRAILQTSANVEKIQPLQLNVFPSPVDDYEIFNKKIQELRGALLSGEERALLDKKLQELKSCYTDLLNINSHWRHMDLKTLMKEIEKDKEAIKARLKLDDKITTQLEELLRDEKTFSLLKQAWISRHRLTGLNLDAMIKWILDCFDVVIKDFCLTPEGTPDREKNLQTLMQNEHAKDILTAVPTYCELMDTSRKELSEPVSRVYDHVCSDAKMFLKQHDASAKKITLVLLMKDILRIENILGKGRHLDLVSGLEYAINNDREDLWYALSSQLKSHSDMYELTILLLEKMRQDKKNIWHEVKLVQIKKMLGESFVGLPNDQTLLPRIRDLMNPSELMHALMNPSELKAATGGLFKKPPTKAMQHPLGNTQKQAQSASSIEFKRR